MDGNTSSKASTSDRALGRPRLNRTPSSARGRERPSASSTGEGSTRPGRAGRAGRHRHAGQVERLGHQLAGRAIEAGVDGAGHARRAGAVHTRARQREHAALELAGQLGDAGARRDRIVARGQLGGGAQPGDAGARSRCRAGARAPGDRRGRAARGRARGGSTARRPPSVRRILCADSATASAPSDATSTAMRPTACTASQWTSAPADAARVAMAGQVLHGAELVVGQGDGDDRGAGGQRAPRARRGRAGRPGPLEGRQPRPRGRPAPRQRRARPGARWPPRARAAAGRRRPRPCRAQTSRGHPPRCRRW